MNAPGTQKLPEGLRVQPGAMVTCFRDAAGHLVLVAGGVVLLDLDALVEQVNKTGGTHGTQR